MCSERTLGKLRNLTSIYLTWEDRILLLYRQGSRVVNNVWVSSAGGHFEKDELNDAYACCIRELYEELSVTEDMIENINLRYITLYRNKKDIRQNYYFFATLKDGGKLNLNSNEGISKWFFLDEIRELDMPFTSRHVIAHYLDWGRFTNKTYVGISTEDQMVFHELTEFE